jgi:hypothetical protein
MGTNPYAPEFGAMDDPECSSPGGWRRITSVQDRERDAPITRSEMAPDDADQPEAPADNAPTDSELYVMTRFGIENTGGRTPVLIRSSRAGDGPSSLRQLSLVDGGVEVLAAVHKLTHCIVELA